MEIVINKDTIKIIKWIYILSVLSLILYLSISTYRNKEFKNTVVNKGLVIKNLDNVHSEDGKLYASLEIYNLIKGKKFWCISTNSETCPNFKDEHWQKIVDNKCDVEIHDGDKYLYIRDRKISSQKNDLSEYISCITRLEIKNSDLKLIKDQEKELDLDVKAIGNPEIALTYLSDDENIAKIENNKIICVGDGITKITVSDNFGHSDYINVQGTSLITLPQINNSKPFISNKQYSSEQAKILDDYLFYQIDEAGYKTRAGVTAAARFLTLELKYRIPYFIENGRITHFNHQKPYCDGEGRYYHRGLYLSEDKFKDIEKSVSGPAMWGAYIKEWSEDNGIIRNGLDCSGFVCWCLINRRI